MNSIGYVPKISESSVPWSLVILCFPDCLICILTGEAAIYKIVEHIHDYKSGVVHVILLY